MIRRYFFILILTLILNSAPVFSVNKDVLNTLINKAESLYQNEEYERALSHINYALKMKASDKKARLVKAEILLAMGNKKECSRIVTEILKWDRKNKKAISLYLKANPPKQPRWLKFKKMISLIHKKFKSSLKRKKPLTARDYRKLASDAVRNELYITAERNMRDAIRLEPNNIKNRMLLADVLEKDGKFFLAAQEYDRIIKLTKKNWKTYYKAGSLYRKANHLDLAYLRFKKALKLNGSDATLIYELLKVSKALNDDSYYSNLLEEKVGTILTAPKFYHMRATNYIEHGEWQKASEDIKKYVETLGSNDNSELYLLDLLNFLSNGGGNFIFKNKTYSMEKQTMDDFKKIFRKVDVSDLYSMASGNKARRNIAKFLNNLGFKSSAIRMLKKMLKEKETPETYYLLAKIYDSMNMSDDVEEALNSAEIINETFIPARLWLGKIYLKRDEFERARSEFDTILKMEEKNIGALLGMAELFFELNDKPSMEEYVERLQKLAPSNSQFKKLKEKIQARGR